MPHRPRSFGLTFGAVLILTLALTGCGEEDGVDAGPTSAVPTSEPTPTKPPTDPPSVEATTEATTPPATTPDAVPVEVADLPTGPPPQLDVLVDGTLLIHEGRDIQLSEPLSRPLGSYDGTVYATRGTQVGDQLVSVAGDGSVTPLGEPHYTYNYFPLLVPETGRVLFVDQDRGTGAFVLRVVDAATGDEVTVVRSGRGEPDYSALEPAERLVAEAWDGRETSYPGGVYARSADGAVEVLSPNADTFTYPTVLTMRRAGESRTSSFAFPEPVEANDYLQVVMEDIVVESDDAFLVKAGVGDGSPELAFLVLRCTFGGGCERVTDDAGDIQVAGTDTIVPDEEG